ncbi:MAG: hypothetical protein ABI321_03960 [Polyangia bacterium]
MKLMAARGMAPLPPPDLVVAIYQLGFSLEDPVREAAIASASELPDAILQAALAAPLDPRVLDFFARRVTKREKLVQVVLLNRAVHDETLRYLATVLDEASLETIAKNDERLLRSPGIIAALYLNPRTRMSTAQRIVELAARNGVRVDEISTFDEITRSVLQDAASVDPAQLDAEFKDAAVIAVTEDEQAVALDEAEAAEAAEVEALLEEPKEGAAPPEQQEKEKRLEKLSPAAKIRIATLGNSFSRGTLIRDKNKQVSMACIKSPGVSDAEALKYANNRSLDANIVAFISNNRAWTRLPGIRLALCNNPKTPLPTTLRMLPTLNIRDLKILMRSKGIPAVVCKQAKELVQARGA